MPISLTEKANYANSTNLIMTSEELVKKAWTLRKQTQGNIFVCYAAIITNADNPQQYVRTTPTSEAMKTFREWKSKKQV